MSNQPNLSAKGQTTIDLLDTTAEQWGMTPYAAPTQEMRRVRVAVKCKHCSGHGLHYGGSFTDESGVVADKAYFYYANKEQYEADHDYTTYDSFCRTHFADYGITHAEGAYGRSPKCQTCSVSTRGYKGRGYTVEVQDVLCNIHRPAWPAETTFNSRYNGHDCELCGKNHIKSGTYAVIAQRADGSHEGMFVGNACVKKLGFKAFKTVEQVSVKNMESRQSNDGKLDLYERTYRTHEDLTVEEA